MFHNRRHEEQNKVKNTQKKKNQKKKKKHTSDMDIAKNGGLLARELLATSESSNESSGSCLNFVNKQN